jgi:hypothetical protein
MNDSGTTQCLLFEDLFGKRVEVLFSGAATSSDGGALLLKGADRRLGLIKAMSRSISDRRDASRVRHEIEALISQRVYGLACGYEDGNDAAKISSDPVMKLISGRDVAGQDLASQPSISRFENSVRRADLLRLGRSTAEVVVDFQRSQRTGRAEKITIDLDQTDDPAHGEQQLSLFNGHYGNNCFIPLLGAMTFNDEPEQFLFAAVLRPGNAPDKRGAIGILRRILLLLRKAFPKTPIHVRLDAGFCAPEILNYLESEGLFYAVGFGQNSVLNRVAASLMRKVRRESRKSGQTERRFTSTRYAARTWKTPRTVVIKAEVTRVKNRDARDNPRYVVTNLPQDPQTLYEEFYCQRGEFENRIKELKLDLKIDRTSCSKFLANQFRVLLTLAAYILLQQIRLKAHRTTLARATVGRLRLAFIKVAARVTSSVRRIFIELPRAYPFQRDWLRVAAALSPHT